jgi:hypothetical protein
MESVFCAVRNQTQTAFFHFLSNALFHAIHSFDDSHLVTNNLSKPTKN